VFTRHGDGKSPALVPEICRFLGIVIGMFYREHGLPHFHAVYGEHKITVEIESGTVHGTFPSQTNRCRKSPNESNA
jgi:hypothetical protein